MIPQPQLCIRSPLTIFIYLLPFNRYNGLTKLPLDLTVLPLSEVFRQIRPQDGPVSKIIFLHHICHAVT
jgi:hypothetical protein